MIHLRLTHKFVVISSNSNPPQKTDILKHTQTKKMLVCPFSRRAPFVWIIPSLCRRWWRQVIKARQVFPAPRGPGK